MNIKSLLAKGKDYFYIMHLSAGKNDRRKPLWNYAKEKNIIGLDLPGIVTDDWNKVKESLRASGQIYGIWDKQFELFYEMEKDDIVVILAGWVSILGVARVVGDPKYDKDLNKEFFQHTRKVLWEKKYDFDHSLLLSNQVKGFNRTLQKVEQSNINKRWMMNIELEVS